MDDYSELTNAAFRLREKLDFRVTELQWPSWLELDCIYDYHISIQIEGRKSIGRGTSFDPKQAMNCAVGEAFERDIWRNLDKTVSRCGVPAVHITRDHAAESSLCELLERDAFFCHFLTGSPLDISIDLPTLIPKLKDLESHLKNLGINLSTRQLKSHHEWPAVIAVASGIAGAEKPFGVAVGLGCKRGNLLDATSKAILECLRVLSSQFLSPLERPLTHLPNATPQAHLVWARNPEASRTLHPLLSSVDLSFRPSLALEDVTVQFEELKGPIYQQLPIEFAIARHPSALMTYFGSPLLTDQQFKRLSEFALRKVEASQFPKDLHPLG